MRINKYIAACGICSRRAADKLIEEGRVRIDNKICVAGDVIDEAELSNGKLCVYVDDKAIYLPDEKRVYAYYKPIGVTCTEKDEHAKITLVDELKRLNIDGRVTYAGRLDKESEGLLILTDDGDLIQTMMKGQNAHEKEYIVKIDRSIDRDFLHRLSQGVYIPELDVTTRRCKVKFIGEKSFGIILTQGINRQIRRMCAILGARVVCLKRIRVVNVLLGDMNPGEIRQLSKEEINDLWEVIRLKQI